MKLGDPQDGGEIEKMETWKTVAGFEHTFALEKETEKPSVKQQVTDYCRRCMSKEKLKSCLHSNFPFVRNMRGYKITRDLPSDVISGLTVGIMQIPQGKIHTCTCTNYETTIFYEFLHVILFLKQYPYLLRIHKR